MKKQDLIELIRCDFVEIAVVFCFLFVCFLFGGGPSQISYIF